MREWGRLESLCFVVRESWTTNDLLLHMYSSFYSCWENVGVVQSSKRTHWRNETNESTLWEIMMSSSISIHIPFITKIIDFLVLFSPHTHSTGREKERKNVHFYEIENFPTKILNLCEFEYEWGIKYLWLTLCFNIFQRGNDEHSSLLSNKQKRVMKFSWAEKVMENALIIGLL